MGHRAIVILTQGGIASQGNPRFTASGLGCPDLALFRSSCSGGARGATGSIRAVEFGSRMSRFDGDSRGTAVPTVVTRARRRAILAYAWLMPVIDGGASRWHHAPGCCGGQWPSLLASMTMVWLAVLLYVKISR